MKIIKRDTYLNQIIAGRENGLIKIITGLRRAGKSFLLFRLYYTYLLAQGVDERRIIRIAFDDWEMRHFRNPEYLMEHLKSWLKEDEMNYIMFDEVQLLDDFVPVLNGLLRKDNVDLYVTGSNSKFLSSDVATEFRGRGDQIHVYPLSFAEFLSAVDMPVESAWKEYSTYGGLPNLVQFDNDKKKIDYLRNVYLSVYLKDICERHRLRNKTEFEELIEIIASTIGSPCNPTKLSNTFRSLRSKTISPNTISRYLSYLTDAFIVENSKRYDVKGKKYINSLSKYYFCDVGLRNSILDFRQQEESHLMENIIYNELKIRGYSVDVGMVEVRASDSDGKQVRNYYEVDFVANLGNKRYYIQSALRMATEQKVHQESQSLVNIDDSFKKIIIVNQDIKAWRNEKGILIISLFDFLLNPESLDE